MFYEISGTVAQNVNIFILLHFSQEDLLLSRNLEKRAESGQELIKLSLQSVTLNPGQFVLFLLLGHGPLGDLI